MPTPQSITAPTSGNTPPIEKHSGGSVPLQFVRQRLYQLSAPNLGLTAQDLDEGVDFFQAQGALANGRY